MFYFTYPLTAHWMAAVVLLLIQGKLTDNLHVKPPLVWEEVLEQIT